MPEFRLKTGEVVTLDDYQAQFPNVSFAADFVPPDAELVAPAPPPAPGMYQRAERNGVEKAGGQWRQAWRLVPWPAEEIDAYKAAERVKVKAAIKAERDRRQSSGVLVDGCWFHTDNDARIKYMGLVVLKLLGQPVPSVTWTSMDGTFCTMTEPLALGIFQAVVTLDQQLFAAAEAHRQAMLNYADPAAYDFSAGWPAAFRG